MIKTVTVTNYLGESLTLELSNPFDIGINVRSIEGIGPPKGNVNYTEIASGDGGQFNSARASIRNITMQLGLMPVPTVEESRHRVYKYFPLDQQVTLRFETDKRLCEITGWVEECEPDIFSDDETIDVSIVCPDPYFYSVDSQLGALNFSGVVDEFEFPFENSPDNESKIAVMAMAASTSGDVPEFDSIIQDAYELRNVIGKVGIQAFNVNNVYTDKQWVVENGVIKLKNSPGKCCAKELFYYDNGLISRHLQFKTTSSTLKARYVTIKGTTDPEIYTGTSDIGPEGNISYSFTESGNFLPTYWYYYFVNFNEDDMSVRSGDVMICNRGNSVEFEGKPADPDIYYDYEPFDISDWEETPDPGPDPDPDPDPGPEPEPGEDNGFPDPPGEYPLYPVEVDQADTTNQYIEFASLVYRQEENIPYDGDVPTGVVMRLHATGEVRNITIYNMGTRERIVISTDRIKAITGHDFNTGDDIIITTTRGSKSIEYVHEGISYNILNALEKDTDWFMLSKGDNVFAYICEYGTEDLQFRFEYPTLYWGI